jgi:hypothetical protein
MADAYQDYTNRCCCYAHIRRYLLEAIPKGHEKDYTHPAVQGFLYCNKLFEYERTYKEKGLSWNEFIPIIKRILVRFIIRDIANGTYCFAVRLTDDKEKGVSGLKAKEIALNIVYKHYAKQ